MMMMMMMMMMMTIMMVMMMYNISYWKHICDNSDNCNKLQFHKSFKEYTLSSHFDLSRKANEWNC